MFAWNVGVSLVLDWCSPSKWDKRDAIGYENRVLPENTPLPGYAQGIWQMEASAPPAPPEETAPAQAGEDSMVDVPAAHEPPLGAPAHVPASAGAAHGAGNAEGQPPGLPGAQTFGTVSSQPAAAAWTFGASTFGGGGGPPPGFLTAAPAGASAPGGGTVRQFRRPSSRAAEPFAFGRGGS